MNCTEKAQLEALDEEPLLDSPVPLSRGKRFLHLRPSAASVGTLKNLTRPYGQPQAVCQVEGGLIASSTTGRCIRAVLRFMMCEPELDAMATRSCSTSCRSAARSLSVAVTVAELRG